MLNDFDNIAPIYDRLIKGPDRRLLSSLLEPPADGVFLDAAGGTGRASRCLQDTARIIVVCDSSPRMLHAAKTKGMITALAHLEDLPFRDNCFDRILLVDAFHHLRDQETASRELIRVLKPSGRLLIEEPDCGRLPVKIAAFLEKVFMMRSNFFPPETMIRMINALGGHANLVHKDRLRVWIAVSKQ